MAVLKCRPNRAEHKSYAARLRFTSIARKAHAVFSATCGVNVSFKQRPNEYFFSANAMFC